MKKVLAVIALVCLLAGAVSASNTEYRGMGGIPMQLTETDQLLYVYPSQVLNFGNEITIEYNTGGTIFGYTLLQMKGSALVIGLSPSPMAGTGVSVTLTDTIAGFTPAFNNVTNAITAIYGLNLGKISAALNVMYGSALTSTSLQTAAGVTDKDLNGIDQTFLKLALGATLDIGLPLDVVVSLTMPNYASNPKVYNAPPALALTNDNFEKLSKMDIGIGARTKMGSWIYDLSLALNNEHAESRTWTDAAGDGNADVNTLYTSDLSSIALNLLACNKIPATKTITMLIGGGLSFDTTGGSPKDKTINQLPAGTTTYGTNANARTNVNLPVYFEADCKINDTFVFRAGVNKNLLTLSSIDTQTVNPLDGTTIVSKSSQTTFNYNSGVGFAMGLSGTFGDLRIDWLVNRNMILQGPTVISGVTNNFGTQLALNYLWK